MIGSIKHIFDKLLTSEHDSRASPLAEHEVNLAIAALLVETAKADFDYSPDEKSHLTKVLEDRLKLSLEESKELVGMAEKQVESSISLGEFSRIINASRDLTDKVDLLSLFWEVAYADGSIDKYEEYLLRKLADLLYIPHKGYITAKLRAEKRFKGV